MTSFNKEASKRDLNALRNDQFDVVIVGGGITGAWLLLHCAQQGYKTALIEKADYASRTSAASSKMLHSGIRYLQQMQFDKVRESAMERAEYIYAAPHLSDAIPFAVPTYRDFKRSKFFLSCGMLAYQTLCLGENSVIESKEERLPSMRSISANELNRICELENEPHTGAIVFYERHMIDSERMVLAIIQTARDLGAQAHNYVCAQSFLGEADCVTGVLARDELTGDEFEINAKLVVNAAGPWVDNLNGKLLCADKAPSINNFAVGSHIVTRQLSDHAIALTTKLQANTKIDRGGRHVFAIPWRGYSLIGTSYDEITNPNGDVSLQAEHVDQLLEAINEAMPSAKLTRDDIVSGYSGLYDYRTNNIKSTVYQGSGEYQVIDHLIANKVNGLVTALGAKFTTGRKISQITMALIDRKISNSQTSTFKRSAKRKLRGSDYASFSELQRTKLEKYKEQFTPELVNHLLVSYGTDIDAFINRIAGHPDLEKRICQSQPDILGQVVWAIECEQAVRLDDVIYGRTSLGLLGINEKELSVVCDLMSQELGWTSEQRDEQLSHTLSRLEKTQAAIDGEK